MAPRYKLGLGLMGDSPEEDTSLSSIVGNAIMPSLDTSSNVVPTEGYTPAMPNIDFDSLNPAEPEVPVGTPNVDYLSSILNEAKQIKDLREQASVAAKQELDPEQSIATVLMSAIPALLGLAVSGKRGLASAGLVSGPAAMKYAEERRNDRKNEAAALNQQATALQQALNLKLTEEGREQRSLRALQAQTANTTATRDALEAYRSELIDLRKQGLAQSKEVSDSKVSLPFTEWRRENDSPEGKPIRPNEDGVKAYVKVAGGAAEIRSAISRLKAEVNDPKATSETIQPALNALVLGLRKPGFADTGSTFTGGEERLIKAPLPVNFRLPDLLSPGSVLDAIEKQIGNYDPKTAIKIIEAYVDSVDSAYMRTAGLVPEGYYNNKKDPISNLLNKYGVNIRVK